MKQFVSSQHYWDCFIRVVAVLSGLMTALLEYINVLIQLIESAVKYV